MSNDMLPFICGSIRYIDRSRFAIEYIYKSCAQKSHRFLIIAPEIDNNDYPNHKDYESNIEYEYACAYSDEADIEIFTCRLYDRLLENEKYYIYCNTITEKRSAHTAHMVYTCTEKSYKFVSKIVIMDYCTEKDLNEYEQYFLKHYQRIKI